MDKNLKALIDLYAEYSSAKLEGPDAGKLFEKAIGEDYTKFYTQKWFIDAKKIIYDAKVHIETKADNADPKIVVVECLKYAWNKIIMNNSGEMSQSSRLDIEVFRELVLKTYENRFSTQQQKFFADTIERLMKQNLYFISYTNRLAPIINNTYYENICKFIPATSQAEPTDKLNRNLLAHAMYAWLFLKNYKKGFFDIESIRKTENIPAKVKTNMQNSFALIQLIDSAAFANEEVNWPHSEFQDFISTQNPETSNMFFYITESSALPDTENQVYAAYRNWYNQITQHKNNKKFYKDVVGLEEFKLNMKNLMDDLFHFSVKKFEEVPS